MNGTTNHKGNNEKAFCAYHVCCHFFVHYLHFIVIVWTKKLHHKIKVENTLSAGHDKAEVTIAITIFTT